MKKKIMLTIFIIIVLIIVFFSIIVNTKTDNFITTNNNSNTNEITLTLVGDLLFEEPFYDAVANGYDMYEYFSLVKDLFLEDDLTIGNMEVVIGNDSLEVSGTGYNFCAPEYIGNLVSSLDFEVLTTANNHAYDRGIEGVYSTIDYFNNNTDIITVGTYKSIGDRSNYRVIEMDNIKVGILSYTYGTNQTIDSEYEGLIALYKDKIDSSKNDEYLETIKKEVEEIKEISDVLIVAMHWGTEFTFTPNEEQIEMANFLNSLGVDIIIGNHSHSIQPIEVIDEEYTTVVFYSLGNFTSADDDIARTPKGEETYDNAYQFGLIGSLTITKENDNITVSNIKTTPVINYFDTNMENFKLIPYELYTEEYEKSHYRYSYGLTYEFIKTTYESVISEEYR